MAEVIMTCGKICSGKSTYAQKLRDERNAVILSVDEITLALFPDGAGDMLDTYVERAEKLLFRKSLEIIRTGTDVVLDWGFWTRTEREYARDYYRKHGIHCELHYLDIIDEIWQQRIEKRNRLIEEGKISAYYVDRGLAEKFAGIFEVPDEKETDLIIKIN